MTTCDKSESLNRKADDHGPGVGVIPEKNGRRQMESAAAAGF